MGKRGNSEGTIRKRSDGRWEARLLLEDGKRKSLYGKTRQEAVKLLAQAVQEREQGIVANTDRQTIEQYLPSWVETVKKHKVEPSTYINCRLYVRKHLVPALGAYQLTKLTAQQVQSLYARKLEDGYAPGTVRLMHITLHDALSHAVRVGLVQRNVADMVDPPPMRHEEMAILDEDQVHTLLDEVAGDRLEALIMLALATGMREGELIALRWRDVDLERGTLRVMRTLKRGYAGYQFGKPKTKRSQRIIGVPTTAITALRTHRVRQLEERFQVGDAWQDQDLVFCNEVGARLSLNRFDADGWFGRLLQRAHLPLVRFHDMRHTAATLLLARGVNVKVVSEMLGHSSIAITLSLYGHVLPHMQQQAAATMDDVLSR